jgi:hypothetical protein
MTEIVPPEDKYNPVPRRVVLAIATACALFAAGSESGNRGSVQGRRLPSPYLNSGGKHASVGMIRRR